MEENSNYKERQIKSEKLSDQIIGVILLNLGGPDSIPAVRHFLYNLFSDRQIIQLGPSFLQKPLAWLISTIRAKKTEKAYKLIGGKSPILEITKAQAESLEETLNQKSAVSSQQSISSHPSFTKRGNQEGVSFKVYVGMRYWHPFIEDVISEIYNDGIRKLIALSLYPQYSVTTSGSSLSKFKEVISIYQMETISIPSWHNHSLYIEALVDMIKKGIESFYPSSLIPHPSSFEDIHVLFSAHSLPQKIIEKGDPYVEQTTGTIREITKRIHLQWHLGYQSKSGPVKWLSPSTEEKLEELSKKGVKNILMVPISFVSDHIETLYEIDILYKKYAEKLGINLKRTNSLNTHPIFIEALKDIVIKSVRDAGWA
jgi:ferrochelatase